MQLIDYVWSSQPVNTWKTLCLLTIVDLSLLFFTCSFYVNKLKVFQVHIFEIFTRKIIREPTTLEASQRTFVNHNNITIITWPLLHKHNDSGANFESKQCKIRKLSVLINKVTRSPSYLWRPQTFTKAKDKNDENNKK